VELIYQDIDGNPLTNCPHCGGSLLTWGGIDHWVTVHGVPVMTQTYLDEEGTLVDDEEWRDDTYHDETCCGCCGHSLALKEIQMEVV
jgi:Zn-finger nucleic acid-binding protein